MLRKLIKDDKERLIFVGTVVIAANAGGAWSPIGDVTTTMLWIGGQITALISIGLLSSIVDNVPIVAAVQGTYDLTQYPTDHFFWEFLAYCAGTGGSALIIGSAAGVAAMGMEKINFFWYLKKISWLALIGFFLRSTYIYPARFYIALTRKFIS